ncbi:sigma-54 interaction domain-containing protein [Geothermobacter hydrogeniphilus]|uniref:HTH-type transcriptional regulatory protein TyrR n=1 Tax=Geothermobacter hydrogeniphilus TaxID=1969733 RepID=A0A1X0Y091_9BACT|nr:sigma 54-interacting transcriptional regulator [Geothermobacter hydrogeniphilus]ORJ58605.1 Fis family transcriptional regulator [Geothermobacter hydrogeniphilus]
MDRSIQELTWEHDAIIDSSSDGLFVCDGQGVILRVNPASERINQATAEQLVGRDYMDAAAEGLVILPSAALEAIEKRQQVSLLQENRFGRKLISTATPVFDDAGELIRVVVSERDITEIDRLQRQLEEQQALGDRFRRQVVELQQQQLESRPIIARSPGMQRALRQALKVSEVDSIVLILGESGVGKGLIADLIHQHSARADRPIIKLNCGAIPETLIEAELFGCEKGAFTGAAGSRPGYLEQADGGILFLDEVAELPPASQVKLLRFLEDGQVTRLGSTRSRRLDVRILAATHRDLQQMVAAGTFRLDLYYRLSVIPLTVPPLRERQECLVPLIRTCIDHFADRSAVPRRLTAAALDLLCAYSYPGNVRELMNICERLVVMSDTELIDVNDLPQTVIAEAGEEDAARFGSWPAEMSMAQILASVERQVLLETAKRLPNQQSIGAALGLSQSSVARKLEKYGIRARFGRG